MNPLLNSIDWDAITGPSRDLYRSPAFASLTADLAKSYKPWEGILDSINVNPLRESMSAMFEPINRLNTLNVAPLRKSSAAVIEALNGLNNIGMSSHLSDIWPSIAASMPTNMLADIDMGVHAPAITAFSSVLSQATSSTKIAELGNIIAGNFPVSDSVMEALGKKLDFFQPTSFTAAVSLGLATPGAEDAVTDLIEEHSEEVEEFVSNFSLADLAALFPAPASEYMRVTGPGVGAIATIGGAIATGTTGAPLVFIVVAAIVVVAWYAGADVLKDREDQRQIEG